MVFMVFGCLTVIYIYVYYISLSCTVSYEHGSMHGVRVISFRLQ